MKKTNIIVVFTFLLLGLFAQSAFAQAQLTEIYVSPGALAKCGPVPNWDITTILPYSPRFTSAEQVYVREQTYDKVTLACEKTSLPQYRNNGGFGYVVNAAGSRYGFTSAGHAYYLGTANGKYLRCHNSVLGIWELQVVAESWTTPPPQSTPPPTPVYIPPTPSPTVQSTPCVGCELYQITSAETRTQGWKARLPTWKEALWAFAEGAGTSALASNDEKLQAALIGGGGSVAKTTAYKAFITPDRNVLALVINGTSYEVRRGKGPVVVMDGTTALTLDWPKGEHIYGKLSNGNICFTAYVQRAFTVSTITVAYRNGNRSVSIPVKSQPRPPIRVGGNNTTVNDIPRGSDGNGGGIPQRVW